LQGEGVTKAETVSGKIASAFVSYPNWRDSEADLRELRNAVTFAVYADEEDVDRVARIVDTLFSHFNRMAEA
jgi:type I restriction enzyme R subunit